MTTRGYLPAIPICFIYSVLNSTSYTFINTWFPVSEYIQLNNKQNFQGEYFSVEENEPLREFGKISDINIFIGANNSRKSRFMRELVKTTIVQTIVKVAERLQSVATDLQGIGDQFSKYSTEGIVSLEIKLPADAPQPRGNEQKWIKLIKIFKVAGSKRIHIDGDYFNSLVQTINTFSSDFSQNNFYAYRNSIEESTALFDFLTEHDRYLIWDTYCLLLEQPCVKSKWFNG